MAPRQSLFRERARVKGPRGVGALTRAVKAPLPGKPHLPGLRQVQRIRTDWQALEEPLHCIARNVGSGSSVELQRVVETSAPARAGCSTGGLIANAPPPKEASSTGLPGAAQPGI